MRPEFDARNVKLIGLSANGLAQHAEWVKDIDEVAMYLPTYMGTPANHPLQR